MDLNTITGGRWILGSEAYPATSGEFLAIIKEKDGTLRQATLEYEHLDIAWSEPGSATAGDPYFQPFAWWLADAEVARLKVLITKAREILDSVPTEWPEVSPSDPALYDHLAAIRNARAVLGGK